MEIQHPAGNEPRTTARLMKLPEVCQQTGLKRSSLYAYANEGLFPKPIKIGIRSSAWRSDAVLRWIEQRSATPLPKMPKQRSVDPEPAACP